MAIEISKNDIAKVVKQPGFDLDEFVRFMSAYVEVDLPEELEHIDNRDRLVDFYFEAVQEQYLSKKVESVGEKPKIEIKLNKEPKKQTPVVESTPDTKKTSKQFVDRKSHIIHLCRESGYTQGKIVTIIDESWGYAAQGKTSKVRVGKTVKQLKESGLVKINSDGLVVWLGE